MKSACCLVKVSDDLRLDQTVINLGEPKSRLTGTLKRIRVAAITRGPKKIITNLYYGRTDQLE
jgi:hypothetical protein